MIAGMNHSSEPPPVRMNSIPKSVNKAFKKVNFPINIYKIQEKINIGYIFKHFLFT